MKSKLLLLSLLLAPLSGFACPEINGKYEMKLDGNRSTFVAYATKVESGKYFYNFDVDGRNDYFAADGVTRRISADGQTGTLTVSCHDNWVKIVAVVDGGETFTETATMLNANQISIQSNVPGLNGIFNKL